jgi:hypothetical protein
MILNVGKTTIIFFTRKTVSNNFDYKLCSNLILCSQYAKDLGDLLDCKLCLHIGCIFSQGLKMLGLINYITYSFSGAHSLCVLYTTLERSKLEYASVAWHSITSTYSFKLERVQRKFAAFCYSSFFLWAYVAVIMKVF